jgi:hypothetical protein
VVGKVPATAAHEPRVFVAEHPLADHAHDPASTVEPAASSTAATIPE